jgi:3-deoxy-7-phosphoheptulonate synthase
MKKHAIKNPSIVIDVSHDNAKVSGVKHHGNQAAALREIMATLKDRPEFRSVVKGFMIESFLKEGCQKVSATHPEELDLGGLSITDPCLGWDHTEELLLELAEFKRKHVR